MAITGSGFFYPYTFLSIPENPTEPNLVDIDQRAPALLQSSHLETIKKTDAIFNFTIDDDVFCFLSRYIEKEIKTGSLIEFEIDDLCSLLEDIEGKIPSESLLPSNANQGIAGTSTYWETMLNTQEGSLFPTFNENSLSPNMGKEGHYEQAHEKTQQCRDTVCQNKKRMTSSMIATIEEKLRQHWLPVQISEWLKRTTGKTVSRSWIYQHVSNDKANGGSLYKEVCYQGKITSSMIAVIEEMLREKWSPFQISRWFDTTGSERTVSAQWIYQYIRKDRARRGSGNLHEKSFVIART